MMELSEKVNKGFYNKNLNPREFFSPLDIYTEENGGILGKCPRATFLKLVNFSRSNFTLYDLEKKLEKNMLISLVKNKYFKYSGLKNLKDKGLSIEKPKVSFSSNDYLYNKEVAILFRIISSNKVMEQVKEIPLAEDFTGLITLLLNGFEEVIIIYKSLYTKGEVSHSLKLVDWLVYINGMEMPIDNKFLMLVTEKFEDLKRSVKEKKMVNKTKYDGCKYCSWERICRTMV